MIAQVTFKGHAWMVIAYRTSNTHLNEHVFGGSLFTTYVMYDRKITSSDLMKSSIFLGHIDSNDLSTGYVCPSTTRNIRSWLV